MLAQSVGATSQAAGNLNSALGRPKVNLAFSVINSIVNLATVYWLTVRYGITGAAFSILLAALVMPAFVHYTNRKVLEIASWPVVRDCYLRSMLAATGVSTASWFLLRPLATSFTSTVLLTGLTASACVLCAYVIGVVKPEDRASLRAALRRSKPAVALDQ
jgi:O-antigen/teichoic acid export membrane protein